MHGGLSPELNDMDQIKRVLRPTDVPDTGEEAIKTEKEKARVQGRGSTLRGLEAREGGNESTGRASSALLLCRPAMVGREGKGREGWEEGRREGSDRGCGGGDGSGNAMRTFSLHDLGRYTKCAWHADIHK